MSSLSEAKKMLQFNQEFVGLVGILKGIAASQFQALMRKRQRFEKFKESFAGFFKLVNWASINSPFVSSQSETTGVVLVTSDEGFMGGLNTKVIQAALRTAGPGQKKIIVLGGRGADTLKDLKLAYTSFPGMIHEKGYEQALHLKDFIVEQVLQKKIGKVILAYPHPISLMMQKPEIVHLLPCDELFQNQTLIDSDERGSGFASPSERGVRGPQRESPRFNDERGSGFANPSGASPSERGVTLESSPETIVKYLVGIWITYRLCDIFEESKLAEIAARTTHLEQSHDRLTEQGKILKHRYFRCRRELIDKGMRETFASILLRRRLQHG